MGSICLVWIGVLVDDMVDVVDVWVCGMGCEQVVDVGIVECGEGDDCVWQFGFVCKFFQLYGFGDCIVWVCFSIDMYGVCYCLFGSVCMVIVGQIIVCDWCYVVVWIIVVEWWCQLWIVKLV